MAEPRPQPLRLARQREDLKFQLPELGCGVAEGGGPGAGAERRSPLGILQQLRQPRAAVHWLDREAPSAHFHLGVVGAPVPREGGSAHVRGELVQVRADRLQLGCLVVDDHPGATAAHRLLHHVHQGGVLVRVARDDEDHHVHGHEESLAPHPVLAHHAVEVRRVDEDQSRRQRAGRGQEEASRWTRLGHRRPRPGWQRAPPRSVRRAPRGLARSQSPASPRRGTAA